MQKRRLTVKRAIALFLAVSLLAWVIFIFLNDEAPDAGRDAFYGSLDSVPDEQNIAIAIAGLNAPRGISIIEYGRQVIDTFNTNIGVRTKLDRRLKFVGDSKEFECWIDAEIERTSTNCASVERIKQLVFDNQELLDRYYSLYEMPYWQGWSGNGSYLLSLNKLIMADIKVDLAEDNYARAYTKWKKNHQFIGRALHQETNAIERAVFLVIEGLSLLSIENLLEKSSNFNDEYYAELDALLKPEGLERYNLKGMLKAEYHFLTRHIFKNHAVYVHPNFVKNRIYRFQLEYLDKASQPPATFEKSERSLREAYKGFTASSDFWYDPFNTLISQRVLNGQLMSLELIEEMHRKLAKTKLLNLSVKIKQQKIQPDEIQNLLIHSGEHYNCPFTDRPMQWDPNKKTISCEAPQSEAIVAEVGV